MMKTFAAFWFTAPLMLLGAAAIAAPIIAHLMNRRTRQRIVFPTIRLLAESTSTQSRLYRIRRWLLLALRCLAVLLLVAAFAQPGCSSRDDAIGTDGDGVSVVYVLDVSASLGRVSEANNLLDALRATVSRSLDALQRGDDRVNVVIADAKPRVLFPPANNDGALTANLDAVRNELANLAITTDRADLTNAIALAGQLIEDAPGLRRVIIISDMQQSNWSGVRLSNGTSPLLPRGTQLTVLPIESATINNVALIAARTAPAHALANQPTNLIAKVANFTSTARDATISANVDGQPIGSETVRLEAGEIRERSFEHTFKNVGLHRVTFTIPNEPPGDAPSDAPADAMTIDNIAYLTVAVSPRRTVFVVGDDDPSALGSSSYFLLRALSPRGDERDIIAAQHITAADLETVDLRQAAAVFVTDAGIWSNAGAKALVDYMNAGGGIIWFAGGEMVEGNINLLDTVAEQPIAPLRLGRSLDVGSVGQSVRIGDGKWNAPALADFDPQSQSLLTRIQFKIVHDVVSVGEGAQVLLQFTNDKPALALQNVGEGRFMLANFSPSLTAGDLGKYGSFPALVHSLMRFVQPTRDWRFSAIAGSSLSAAAPIPVGEPTGSIVLRGPNDLMLTPTVTRDAQRLLIEFPRTKMPGFHGVYRNETKIADIAVNIDPRECDLTPLDAVTLKAQLASDNVDVQVDTADGSAESSPLRGRPLWHWFVVGAMLMIGLELALLAVWNR